ncbi:MAG: YezD family protein [Clostridiales Family XIII bacterium]|jgi:hypothetical protein|nr:YezD family protein [Clostridiales Family XIII bacterium]
MAEINNGTPMDAKNVHGGANPVGAEDSTVYTVRAARHLREEDLIRIIDYINDVRYGSVTVIIQDGNVLQIEKNEKIRLR